MVQTQSNLGIIFLFDDSKAQEISFLNLFVEKLSKIELVIEIVRENCTITSVGSSTNMGTIVKINFFILFLRI